MTRSIFLFVGGLCLLISACTGDSVPTGVDVETETTASVLAKSPRMDGAPIPPIFYNALNPEDFVEFREYPEWVPIIFYRDITCVPHDLNFLSTAFDFRSLGCTPVIDGFLIWPDKNPDLPQVVREELGGDVHMWFVTVEDWFEMAGDGVIGWDEIRSAASFREGLADYYHGRSNFVSSTSEKDIRGYLTSIPDTRFRVHFVGRVEYLDDGSYIEYVPQLNVEFMAG